MEDEWHNAPYFVYGSESYIFFVTSKIDMFCFCCSSIPFFYTWIGYMPVFLPREDCWEYKHRTFPCQFCLWLLAGKYLFHLLVLWKYNFSNIDISGSYISLSNFQIQHVLAPDTSDPHNAWLKCKMDIRACSSNQIERLQGCGLTSLNADWNFLIFNFAIYYTISVQCYD